MTGGGELWGHTLEAQLAVVLDKLMRSELELWQCTPAIAGLHTTGFDEGRASRDTELSEVRQQLARAEHERDLAYARLYNPGRQLHETIQDRLDAAALAIEAQGLPQSEIRFFERVLEHATDMRTRSTRAA